MKKCLSVILLAALLLALPACGQTDTENSGSLCEGGQTTSGATSLIPREQMDPLPLLYLHYDDADARSSVQLTPSDTFTWTSNAQDAYSHTGPRPYEKDGLCTITLADTAGMARLALYMQYPYCVPAMEGWEFEAAKSITLSVKAWPVDSEGNINHADAATRTIEAAQGSGMIDLLPGRYYYELTLSTHGQPGSSLTYGMIAERIVAEEYAVHEEINGCIVTTTYQDPDHMAKRLPRLWLEYPYGEGTHGSAAEMCGEVRMDYVNYAGTPVTLRYPGYDPTHLSDEERAALFADLREIYDTETVRAETFTLAFDPAITPTSMVWMRFDHGGKWLEGEVVQQSDTMKLEEFSVYVMTVQHEKGQMQYMWKTGGITP